MELPGEGGNEGGHYEQRRKAGGGHELVCWERKTWKTHEAGWSFRCMQPKICYLDKWSLSAQIRIVNTPLTIIFPPPQWLLDINVYVTDTGTSKGCLTLKKIITFTYVWRRQCHDLQAFSRSSEQTAGPGKQCVIKKGQRAHLKMNLGCVWWLCPILA